MTASTEEPGTAIAPTRPIHTRRTLENTSAGTPDGTQNRTPTRTSEGPANRPSEQTRDQTSERAPERGLGRAAGRASGWIRRVWPGVAMAVGAVVFSMLVSRYVPALSPAVVAVISGAALASLVGVGERFRAGLAFVSRRVLRLAIALLGLQISLPQVLALGWQTLAIVTAATGLTFVTTPLIGRRLGLSRGTSLLIATGVSICGASAIAAMRESIDLPDDDDAAASALGVVVLYGTAAIAVLPLLASLMDLSPAQLGVWAGAAVHEVAQVAAIGAASGVLAGAVTVKLGRVVLLAPIVALTSYRNRRTSTRTTTGTAARTTARTARPPIVPVFVVAFLAMMAVRSTGWLPATLTETVPGVTNVLMAAALFGLGTGIDVRKLARGGRAVLLGGIATAIIAVTSLAGVMVFV
ncbi:YeiH family protein [Nonomuraea insulae]|uniref:YeiH family protein n=1 Tax=Nonomuraea insulae TaxID=1616787 RepID=A0ABW1CUI3_9ACTN